MITVTGGTGMTGRYVIQALIDAGETVRVLVHSDEALGRLPVGVTDFVVGDMLVATDVRAAVTGADAVVHIGPAMNPREIAMGENVIDAAADARVPHFVLMSVTHPQLEPLVNHQTKLAVERHLLMSKLPYTILQPMHYMQDVVVPAVVTEGVHRQPYSLDVPLSFVDLADVGAVVALVLSDPEQHWLATYELCGADMLTGWGVAAALSSVSGRIIAAERTAVDDVLARMADAPEYTKDGFRRLFAHYDSYGLTGNPNVLRWLLGREPTAFRDYVKRELRAAEFV